MNYFYSQILKNEKNQDFLDFLENYANTINEQIYLLDRPLVNIKYQYNADNVGVVLMRKHKICFVSFTDNNEAEFEEYRMDLLEDINSLSDTYNYKKLIGRVRSWEKDLVKSYHISQIANFADWIKNETIVKDESQLRRLELIITLFIGSINDVSNLSLETSSSIIERVKQKIQMFDCEQTRFIYGNLKNKEKQVVIQGLSGTGKTELLLHKLREVYLSNPDLPVGFTCYNIILADNMRKRIPQFFNFMMVNKQIDWENLLCVNAWGKSNDPYSGIYSYICHYYNISFFNYRQCGNFKHACQSTLKELKQVQKKDDYAFSYMFIDESQDFNDAFFELCEAVTKEKVFIAGDIFQSIFDGKPNVNKQPMIILNNCYRTAPKTLMIAHALGLGLYEKHKLWWLNKNQWEQCGYKVEANGNQYSLMRYPIQRFDNDNDNYTPFMCDTTKNLDRGIIEVLRNIKRNFEDIKPEDVGIIYIDDANYIYDLSVGVRKLISDNFNWQTNVAYETKQKLPGALFISNRNNVKGLEFPVVICVTKGIKRDISYRNTLYTMLTRSFLCSYLLIEENEYNGFTEEIKDGIENTLKTNKIKVTEPTKEEESGMMRWYESAKAIESLGEKINRLFNSLKIPDEKRKEIKSMIENNENLKQFEDDKLSNLIKAFADMI